MRRLAAAAALALALLALAPALAAAACPKTTLPDIEDEVMCPVCGTPLQVAQNAPQAQREREFIRVAIARCESKQAIKDRLAAQFGPAVLAVPRKEGFSLAAWVVPIVVVALAAIALALALPRWLRHRGARAGEGAPAPSAAEQARLDRELELTDP